MAGPATLKSPTTYRSTAFLKKKLIHVDETKCVQCNRCISACPVKFCNFIVEREDGVKIIDVNPDLCIACGHCLDTEVGCHHEARYFTDDFDVFVENVINKKSKKKKIAIVAPGVASVFDLNHLRVNNWLKKSGIDEVYDVSFGAELTIKSYIDEVTLATKDGNFKKPLIVISQPCPAIVNFIQTWCPELLPNLSTSHSPMMHTIQMVRNYYEGQNAEFYVISPCVAKSHEFELCGESGKVFNVTMDSMKNYFSTNNVNINTYPEIAYDGPRSKLAGNFSTSGGLKETAIDVLGPDVVDIIKIEGINTIYEVLRNLAKHIKDYKGKDIIILDVLNCEKGCNGGTATGEENRQRANFVLESLNKTRVDSDVAFYEEIAKKDKLRFLKGILPVNKKSLLQREIDKHWKRDIYKRKYRDLSRIVDQIVESLSEIEKLTFYQKLRGHTNPIDCNACGYDNCKDFAIALKSGLTIQKSCAKSSLFMTEIMKDAILEEFEELNALVRQLSANVANFDVIRGDIDSRVGELKTFLNYLKETVEELRQQRQILSQISSNFADAPKLIQQFKEKSDKLKLSLHLLVINTKTEVSNIDSKAGAGLSVLSDEYQARTAEVNKNFEDSTKPLEDIASQVVYFDKMIEFFSGIIDSIEDKIGIFEVSLDKMLEGINLANDFISSATKTVEEGVYHIQESAQAKIKEIIS